MNVLFLHLRLYVGNQKLLFLHNNIFVQAVEFYGSFNISSRKYKKIPASRSLRGRNRPNRQKAITYGRAAEVFASAGCLFCGCSL